MIRCFCLFALFLFALPTFANEQRVHERVFFIEDSKASKVQFQMLVQAGCGDEAGGCKGLAHYLEHLVLVGRNAQNTDQAMRFFADGQSNGWTTLKATAFTHEFPANSPDLAARLDKLFGFYQARLSDFNITDADATRERNVVRQEHDLRESSNPYFATYIKAQAFLYGSNPMGQATIGTPETIAAFTVPDAKAFLNTWYKLNNVYFLVSGPLQPALVQEVAERHLSGLQKSDVPRRAWLEEALSVTPGRQNFETADKRIAQPSFVISRLVEVAEPDMLKTIAATMLVNEFLRSKISGSPHSVLVENEEVAQRLPQATLSRTVKGTLLFTLMAEPDEGVSLEKLEGAMRSYSMNLAQKGFDEALLNRLKKRFALTYQRELDEPSQTMQRLVQWLSGGLPYEALKDLPKTVEALRLDEVNSLLKAATQEGREALTAFVPKAN